MELQNGDKVQIYCTLAANLLRILILRIFVMDALFILAYLANDVQHQPYTFWL